MAASGAAPWRQGGCRAAQPCGDDDGPAASRSSKSKRASAGEPRRSPGDSIRRLRTPPGTAAVTTSPTRSACAGLRQGTPFTRTPPLAIRSAASVRVFDAYSPAAEMLVNPAKYGFTKPTAICITDPICSTNAAVAAGYEQWDGLHKTTRVHELLADELIALAVPEPASWLMLLGGGVVLRRCAMRKAASGR